MNLRSESVKAAVVCFGTSLFLMMAVLVVAKEWQAPTAESEKSNPVKPDDASISNGKQLFRQLCAFCHGEDGKGMGQEITGLQSDTPSLVDGIIIHKEGGYHWKIRHGKGDMHSFKRELADNEIWDILNYIQSTH